MIILVLKSSLATVHCNAINKREAGRLALTFDIVLVLYNSAAWLPVCLEALSAVEYPRGDLHLILVDNASTDEPAQVLDGLREKLAYFGSVQIQYNKKNKGFGAACNQGAALGSSENIFFLNIDTEVSAALFSCVEKVMQTNKEVAAFECRQLPYETGHHINPVSLHTTWASAAALIVRRPFFEEIDGFDEKLFMYCEDVDLGWRLRAAGHSLKYMPMAQVFHYSFLDGPDGSTSQMKLSEYTGSFYGNLLLRYKFGTLRDIVKGHFVYLGALRRPLHFENVRRVLAKNYLRHFIKLWPFLFWRWRHRRWFKARVGHFDGGFSPDRGHFKWHPLPKKPLVSVLLGEFSTAEGLACALQNLQNQTYTNFEVLLQDRGEGMLDNLRRQCSDLTLRTYTAPKNAANFYAGAQVAKGEYVCFLGLGQYFYPDHIELMIQEAQTAPQASMIAGAFMVSPSEEEAYALTKTDFAKWREGTQKTIPWQCILVKRAMILRETPAENDLSLWQRLQNTVDITVQTHSIPRATSLLVVPIVTEGTIKDEI